MKKCPTCEKTFDDNLKFCQTDGTPLVAVEEAPPEDPYKTTVANASDLPIPPLDPFKTMVASPIPPPRAEEPKPEVKEDVAEIKEEIDPMKTIVSTDFPPFKQESKPEVREEPKADAPPSPFGSAPPQPKSEVSKDISATPPEPPKFSEPNLNPPSFGDMSPKSASPPIETPFAPPPVKTSSAPPPLEVPSEPVSPPPAPSKPFEMSQPEVKKSGDFSGDSPYGDTKNAPIPSPFDLSMPPGYQIPSAPMPPYKEVEIEEIKAEALNTPFAEEIQQQNQQIEPQQGWNPPPAPNANWQDPQIGQNTPFQPPPAGMQGQNKTLAFVSLGLGILGLVLIVPTLIIPLCGVAPFFLGIGAAITGFLARSRAKAQPEQYGGGGLGIGGLLLGIVCMIAPIAIFILTFAVMYVYRG